ncbi:MAG: tRNA (adenosine(37)-N6)-dimethylallyltransferase MiaA [Ferruginibacter sp.]
MNKTCIIIAGPTAVGKTSIALAIARHFSTEIISADSRQCFKELNIGVAKPTAAELEGIHHYFINSHSIHDDISAADFERYALNAVEGIFLKNDIAVMVGGTGLYIKAFCEGMDEIPAVDSLIRNSIITDYNNKGIDWLREQIKNNDLDYFSKGEIENPQRMMRALEVKLSTGKSIISFRSGKKEKRDFNIITIALELPRDILYQRINARVDDMMKAGLLEEARSLIPFKHLNALQTVGYRELFDHFDGKYSLERAVELIKQNSRNYAKRQLTWFKKDPSINWLAPGMNIMLKYLGDKFGNLSADRQVW